MKRVSPYALLLLVVVVAGYVVLAVTHVDTSGYGLFVGPIVAAAVLAAKFQDSTDQQNVTLGEIHDQTNGKLTERLLTIVPAAVESVLQRHGLIPDPASAPAPAPALADPIPPVQVP